MKQEFTKALNSKALYVVLIVLIAVLLGTSIFQLFVNVDSEYEGIDAYIGRYDNNEDLEEQIETKEALIAEYEGRYLAGMTTKEDYENVKNESLNTIAICRFLIDNNIKSEDVGYLQGQWSPIPSTPIGFMSMQLALLNFFISFLIIAIVLILFNKEHQNGVAQLLYAGCKSRLTIIRNKIVVSLVLVSVFFWMFAIIQAICSTMLFSEYGQFIVCANQEVALVTPISFFFLKSLTYYINIMLKTIIAISLALFIKDMIGSLFAQIGFFLVERVCLITYKTGFLHAIFTVAPSYMLVDIPTYVFLLGKLLLLVVAAGMLTGALFYFKKKDI